MLLADVKLSHGTMKVSNLEIEQSSEKAYHPDAPIQVSDSNQAILLHGLYVAPDAQG